MTYLVPLLLTGVALGLAFLVWRFAGEARRLHAQLAGITDEAGRLRARLAGITDLEAELQSVRQRLN